MSTFLSAFDGLWRRPNRDYKNAVRNYRIVVDTNVLLELYRFTPAARNELLDVLRQLKGRLWIPHQVAAEYYNRRLDAVKEHLALYESVPSKLQEQQNKALQEINAFAKRCSMNRDAKRKLTAPIEQAFAAVQKEVERHREQFDLTLELVIDSDPILAALGNIFDGRTGQRFDGEKESELLAEFQRRVAEKIPPGYKDAGKPENPHGDYFAWEQILCECSQNTSPLLFVTNDAKEDWLRREAGLIVGARPELVLEFRNRCNEDFLITQLGRFLQIAKEELGASVSESTVQQAENVARHEPRGHSQLITLPARDFAELQAVLREAAFVSNKAFSRLSAGQAHTARNTVLSLIRIHDHISRMAESVGGDVKFSLDSADWELAYHVWMSVRASHLSVTELVLEISRSASVSAEWNRLATIEADLKHLKRERDALLIQAASESERLKTIHIESRIEALERELIAIMDGMQSDPVGSD